MYRFAILILCIMVTGCKLDKPVGKELIEIGDAVTETSEGDSLEVTDEILDVAAPHLGVLVHRDGRYAILASDFVNATFSEDYPDLQEVEATYPGTFSYTSRKTADTPGDALDSIVTLKYKNSSLEFRKTGTGKGYLLIASLRSELFLLQNGIRTGMDRQETLARFGIREQVKEDTIDVISESGEQKIILHFSRNILQKIELVPEVR